ncbi:phage scaffolding protein [Anaeromassilibacillus senegalensis]|uniref:phage scaffolding protein n=1 Tax=Anaeromassilibacillus senegalensis TaxID=1673717 RepID=UPI000682EB3D|nr:phage scaffolding protein [Anaeromassilibacillus senegalensis]
MKREFLQNFKVGDQTLTKEIIDAIMEENGKDIEATKKPLADYEDVKNQLAKANETINGFKDMDIETVRKEAEDWKQKAEQAEKDAAAKIANMEFQGLLTQAITAAKGKNAKAVTALLDVDTLKASKNQEADIKTALEALKKDSGYLFESDQIPPPYAGGTGTQKLIAGPDAALRAAMGLPEPETK